jgi:hypothetical protein
MTDTTSIPADLVATMLSADELTLCSLQPQPHAGGVVDLQGWPVLGKLPLQTAEDRAKVIDALQHGVQEFSGAAAFCFNPRHALAAVNGEHRLDLIICFECHRVRVYVNSVEGNGFPTTNSPLTLFNQLLHDAGIELAPSPPNVST